jgi:hypothetical protein
VDEKMKSRTPAETAAEMSPCVAYRIVQVVFEGVLNRLRDHNGSGKVDDGRHFVATNYVGDQSSVAGISQHNRDPLGQE